MARDLLDNALDSVLDPGLEQLYEQAGKKYNINPLWLKAQDLHEIGPQGGDATAGDAEHVGHGQLGPSWRKQLGLGPNPSAAEGIMGMAQVMRQLIDKHGGDIGAAQQEYTGGPDQSKWGANTQAYPGRVAANYNSLGGTPGQIAYPANQGDVLDQALKDVPLAERPSIQPAEPTSWGFNQNFGSALALGHGPELSAGMGALYKTIDQKLNNPKFANIPFSDLLKGNYQTEHSDILGAQAQWREANPGKALATDLVGGTLPTAAALALGHGEVVAPLARGVSSSIPAAETAVNMLTANMPADAGLLARAGSRVVPGIAGGTAAGVLQSSMSDRPVGEQAETGALAGGLLGPLGGAVGDAFSSQIAPRVARLANGLLDSGVPLQAGQIPGVSPIVKMFHNWLGDKSGASQRTGLAGALSRTFGENSTTIDNDLLRQAHTRIGNNLDALNNVTINKSPDFANSIVNVLSDARGDLGEGGSGIPKDKLQELDDAAGGVLGKGPTISGTRYQNLTKRGSDLDRLMSDPLVGHHAAAIRDILDNELERSASAANGRWVPAQAQAPVPGAASLALPPGANNKLIAQGSAGDIIPQPRADGSAVGPWTGKSGGFTWDGPQSASGSISNPPKPPGMVWEIDPATQDALARFREARGQYKNLKLVSGIANDSTGEIQPSALAARIKRFYPPGKDRSLSPGEQQMQDLASASQFIPNAPTGAKVPSGTKQAAHVGIGMLGAEGLYELAKHDPVSAGYLLAGGLAAGGAAKGANRLLSGSANTRRIVGNALSPSDHPLDLTTLATLPGIDQLYNGGSQK